MNKNVETSAPKRPSKSKATMTNGSHSLKRSPNVMFSPNPFLSFLDKAGDGPNSTGSGSFCEATRLLFRYSSAVNGIVLEATDPEELAMGDHSAGSTDQ